MNSDTSGQASDGLAHVRRFGVAPRLGLRYAVDVRLMT